LFHHAHGQTPGFLAFADELRAGGHAVHTPDLYDGRTFETLDEGIGYAKEVGFEAILQRRLAYDIDGSEAACAGGVGATTPLLTRRNPNEERGRPIGALRSRALTVPASVATLRKQASSS
jgi:hypothetical protein